MTLGTGSWKPSSPALSLTLSGPSGDFLGHLGCWCVSYVLSQSEEAVSAAPGPAAEAGWVSGLPFTVVSGLFFTVRDSGPPSLCSHPGARGPLPHVPRPGSSGGRAWTPASRRPLLSGQLWGPGE